MTCILAVEDSRTQAELLRATLEGAGFQVRLVSNGTQALEVLAAGGIDLVLSDVVMPGMDGYELCRRVKADPATTEVPVVLLTSLADPLDVVSGLEAGADNFIRKPYQREQLLTRLRTTVEHRGQRHGDGGDEPVRLSFLDRAFHVTAERQQLLDLLISTFEELVQASRDVRARQEDLARARVALEQQLQATELERTRLQAVVDAVPLPLFVIGPDGRILHASGVSASASTLASQGLRGSLPEELARLVDADGVRVPAEALPPRQAMREGRPVTAGAAFDLFVAQDDGSRLPVLVHASPILDESGAVTGCVAIAQVLGSLSQHDPVTGLPNRVAFLDQLAGLAGPDAVAVLLVQLDRIDGIGTSLGDRAEEAALAEAARRLRRVLPYRRAYAGPGPSPGECFLASLGGGQFGAILSGVADELAVVRLAEAARHQVGERPYPSGVADCTVSVGVSVGDGAEGTMLTLLAGAGAALQRARGGGGGRVEVLGPGASQEAVDQLQLAADLRLVVEREQVTLRYQPEVDLATGEVLGFEALARWRHEHRGDVRPDIFIGLAEVSGLILPLGRQILAAACREAQTWPQVQGRERPLTVAVNISAVQLRPEFVGEVVEVLGATGLDPARLLIELTETAAMRDPGTTVAVLEELRGHGVRFSLDDFGTGYSSLAQLTRIPFDQLKLDRSFVTTVDQDGANAVVAQSIVALGHALGVPVIAEGVETAGQADALRALGCEQAQGFLFSRPLAGQDVQAYLAGAVAGPG